MGLLTGGPTQAGAPSGDVTIPQAQALLQQKSGQSDFVILDVRTPEEFAEGHLANAVNINVLATSFTAQVTALDRTKTYLVYCRTGHRSVQASGAMRQLGFSSVFNMVGGIVAWQAKGLPVTRK